MSGLGQMTVEAAQRLLSVGPKVDADGLRAARNKAMMTAHPDHGGSEERLRLVIEAHKILEIWIAGGEVPHGEQLDPRLEITPTIAALGGRQVVRASDGRKIAISLPAGLRAGDKVSAGGQVFRVSIKGDGKLFVSGDDLCMQVKASASLLANGGKVRVKTPAGQCIVWVPSQVGSNGIVRVLGRGLPPRGNHPQGALVLKLEAEKASAKAAPKAKRRA